MDSSVHSDPPSSLQHDSYFMSHLAPASGRKSPPAASGGGGDTGQPDKVWNKKTILHLELNTGQRQDLDEVQGPPAFLIQSIRTSCGALGESGRTCGRLLGKFSTITVSQSTQWETSKTNDCFNAEMSVQDRAQRWWSH